MTYTEPEIVFVLDVVYVYDALVDAVADALVCNGKCLLWLDGRAGNRRERHAGGVDNLVVDVAGYRLEGAGRVRHRCRDLVPHARIGVEFDFWLLHRRTVSGKGQGEQRRK